MMHYKIKNRYTGDVQFTAEIECSDDALNSVKIGLAVRWGKANGADLYGANLRGADLRGADLYGANLRGADLRGADLRGADLSGANLYGADLYGADLYGANLYGANLYGADLSGADLRGANLRGADLYGANLRGARNIADRVIDGGIRSDGYRFLLVLQDGERRVVAGCRNLTLPEAREHWAKTRAGTPLGDETTLILDHMERIANLREWV